MWRKYSVELKMEVVEVWREHRLTMAEIMSKYKISAQTVPVNESVKSIDSSVTKNKFLCIFKFLHTWINYSRYKSIAQQKYRKNQCDILICYLFLPSAHYENNPKLILLSFSL